MESTTKQRNQSQCREWERQRRNKFNDAINRLGDIVKNIYKNNESLSENDVGKTGDNVKYPKIEIVQKAIICLTNCAEEKTQLKAEILALQVKLETVKDVKNQKDASTQVFMELNRRHKGIKHKLAKKKPIVQSKSLELVNIRPAVTVNNKPKVNIESKAVAKKTKIQNAPTQKLPTLVPRCHIFDKEGSENTIVVLPATPYLFPQRPFLLPSIPQAIVVVDHSLQPNKGVPIVSRNVGDITKTTMVNILPISAYSRPLSASKQKKSSVRLKNNAKKPAKKIKDTVINEIVPSSKVFGPKPDDGTIVSNKQSIDKTEKEMITEKIPSSVSDTHEPDKAETSNEKHKQVVISEKNANVESNTGLEAIDVSSTKETVVVTTAVSNTVVMTKTVTTLSNVPPVVQEPSKTEVSINTSNNSPQLPVENKEKENKLRTILDSSLDNVVDGGNARLELAEEFLAASPTAAFLMSFPLVSGNRADSPAEENPSTTQALITNIKEVSQKRNDLLSQHNTTTIFDKTNSDIKIKAKAIVTSAATKTNEPANVNNVLKPPESKILPCVTENPFLNLPMPSLVSTTCSLAETTFGLEFDNNIIKPPLPQTTSNSNIFYKNDPFSTAKSTIYSTSSISSNHDFNGIGLYPCAMEKYSKNKSDLTNLDENNVMKIGSSRLTYDIDLGWSHKGFEFFSCTSGSTIGKDNITTVTSSTTCCTSYNPFNPEFHVPLVSTSSKKDVASSKTNTTYVESLPSFYSQHNLWSDDTFYNNTNVARSLPSKQQNYAVTSENVQGISNVKLNIPKHYEIKPNSESNVDTRIKSTNTQPHNQIIEKYKKSPSKMHINWMTSEIRPIQTAYNHTMHADTKDTHKTTYNHLDHITKRGDHNDTNNYFPLSMQMHNFPPQPAQEEFQVWPSTRPLGTTEISIDPPPINLPTLVGDLALGPHDKKKTLDPSNRTAVPHQDLQNCSNFFSVTHLMNRSSENLPSRYQPTQVDASKPNISKHNIGHYSNDSSRKSMTVPRVENNAQPYIFNNPKLPHSYEHMAQFSNNTKPKSSTKSDKSNKSQKNNYSTESLLRGASCSQKIQDNSSKFLVPQKYNDFNTAPESGVAQVSHFPSIIDYTDNSYSAQQFSGTSLYNTTTNTLSNSFYTNFMPGSSNLMPSNYTSGPFTGEFMDYNQSAECNFANHKYEELKMRNNPPIFQTEKVPTNYKSSRRESAKHKLDCSKKESSKKYQSKRAKLNSDVEEWSETTHTLWQNKPNKRNPNLMPEELPFPNYVSNQMHSQYQPEFFNSHLMPSNMQAVGNTDRSLSSIPITSRANFNLSTIFPEITMKVQ